LTYYPADKHNALPLLNLHLRLCRPYIIFPEQWFT
jgi:hypothetical protein